ncbi:MAG TPA: NPCBM/NEW2 domain-containing protein, partial [Thermoanaerobaculia bacterium]|nr:NPCBM/NEW2 domain-containing protein [Thermoanaerobaculia bacterium]
DDRLIAFRRYQFPSGIGMHANATLTYSVPAGATDFQALIGLPDGVSECPEASTVFGLKDQEDKELFRSGVVKNAQPPIPIRVPLQGAKTLTLVVGDAGDGINCDHGTWALAAFLIPGGR